MKFLLSLFTLSLSLTAFAGPSVTAPREKKQYLVAYCAGQSNTLGMTTPIVPSLVARTEDAAILIYEYGNGGTAGNVQHPTRMNQIAPVRYGPPRPLGRRLSELYPDYDIVVFKIAYGGTGLYNDDGTNNWNVAANGDRWVDLKAKITDCDTDLEVSGDTIAKRFFVWYQGDRDAQEEENALAYSTNLQALINGLRSYMGLTAAELPAVVIQTHSIDPEPYVSTVQAQQAAAVAALDEAILVNVDAGVSSDGDGTHLTPDSYEYVGFTAANSIFSNWP